MRLISWLFRRRPVPVVQEPGYTYRFTTHDQSKGAEAFKKSRSEALAIRAKARVDSRDVLHRVK